MESAPDEFWQSRGRISWDIYENRAVATLRKRILWRASPALAEAESHPQSPLDEASEHSAAIRGTRFRRDRLYQIWGEVLTHPSRDLLAEPSPTSLPAPASSLSARHASLKLMPHFSAVESPLHSTNVFQSDAHYRRAFDLWHRWEQRCFAQAAHFSGTRRSEAPRHPGLAISVRYPPGYPGMPTTWPHPKRTNPSARDGWPTNQPGTPLDPIRPAGPLSFPGTRRHPPIADSGALLLPGRPSREAPRSRAPASSRITPGPSPALGCRCVRPRQHRCYPLRPSCRQAASPPFSNTAVRRPGTRRSLPAPHRLHRTTRPGHLLGYRGAPSGACPSTSK